MAKPIQNSTEGLQNFPYSELLAQIDKFPTLEDWWREKVFSPTMKKFFPQLIVLIALNCLILFTRDFLAAFLCFAIIVGLSYNTLTMLSVNMMSAQIITQIRTSFQLGVLVGEEHKENNQKTS